MMLRRWRRCSGGGASSPTPCWQHSPAANLQLFPKRSGWVEAGRGCSAPRSDPAAPARRSASAPAAKEP